MSTRKIILEKTRRDCMTSDEAKEILMLIGQYYPSFERGEIEQVRFKLKTWHEQIVKWDYERTKQKLEDYVLNNKFPPSLSEIKPREQVKYSIKEKLKEIYGEAYD